MPVLAVLICEIEILVIRRRLFVDSASDLPRSSITLTSPKHATAQLIKRSRREYY
jgi:hypothetical protein